MTHQYGKLAYTYSIVARDPKTGEMGAAVQSHYFSVGSVVNWAEAGVGAVCTQSLVNVSFGPRGLDLLREGKSASEALKILIDSDENSNVRQLAIVDAKGQVAVHTGDNCIPEAGHQTGEGYSVQANLMLSDKVPSAMAEAYEKNSHLPLPERIMTALSAAESVGGDIRGKQSAAILIVKGESSGQVWEDRILDLRVEDHPEPIEELSRLLRMFRAYEHMNRGDEAIETGDTESARAEFSAAEALFPDELEMKFWHAVSLVNVGQVDDSLPLFRTIFEQDSNWLTLVKRLPGGGFLTASEDDLQRIYTVLD